MTTATTSSPPRQTRRVRNGHEPVKRYILETFRPGDHIPGEAELSKRLKVSYYAAARALNELNSQGLLVREQGRGSFLSGGQSPARKEDTAAPVERGVQRVAFIAGDLDHEGLSLKLLASLNQQFRNTPYRLAVRSTDFNNAVELTELRHLPDEGFAGAVVLVEETAENLAQLRKLRQRGFPLVLVDHVRDDDDHGAQVAVDHQAGVRMAVQRLAEVGHRRIAFISHTERSAQFFQAVKRMEHGYQEGLAAAGLPFRAEYLRRTPAIYPDRAPTREELAFMTYPPMHQLLCLPEPPTAVVTLNTHFAVGAMRAVLNAGLRIPRDISFAGIGDVMPRQDQTGFPAFLAGASVKVDDLGCEAAKMLNLLLLGQPPKHLQFLIQPHWIDGDSIAPPPTPG